MDDMDTDVPGDRRDTTAGDGRGVFSPPPPVTASATSAAIGNVNAHENAWSLLSLARQLVDQGKPSLALQAKPVVHAGVFPHGVTCTSVGNPLEIVPCIVYLSKSAECQTILFDVLEVLAAMRSGGGEQAVLETLQRARQLYRNRLQANVATDELASLFAECAIAEALPMRSSNPPPPPHAAGPPILPDSDETSILATTGRKQIVLDAFADGSSFVCLQCGGLVSNLRRDEHLAYWCG